MTLIITYQTLGGTGCLIPERLIVDCENLAHLVARISTKGIQPKSVTDIKDFTVLEDTARVKRI